MAELLVTLLCATYAIEQKSLDVIREQIEISDHPDVQVRVKAHLVETQWQIKLLGACLEFQGIDQNILSKNLRKISNEIGNISLPEIKRFEIELYKKIIAAAREQHAPEVLQACREILEQERAMAEWLEDHHSEMKSFPIEQKRA